jgi:hypothetical protein
MRDQHCPGQYRRAGWHSRRSGNALGGECRDAVMTSDTGWHRRERTITESHRIPMRPHPGS